MELSEQIKNNIAAQKALVKLDIGKFFSMMQAYNKDRTFEIPAGCDNLDNALCRAEEIRLLNHDL